MLSTEHEFITFSTMYNAVKHKVCLFQWFLEGKCDQKFHFQENIVGSMIITYKADREFLQGNCIAETAIE